MQRSTYTSQRRNGQQDPADRTAAAKDATESPVVFPGAAGSFGGY